MDEYEISSDASRLDIDVIHEFLASSYWAEGIPRDVVRRSIEGSLCFGVYLSGRQVGFARVVTDRATFGYLADVFIIEEHRGKGLSKRLVEAVMSHPDLLGLRRWMLVTRDAHGLYRQLGWNAPADASRYMEIVRPRIYLEASS